MKADICQLLASSALINHELTATAALDYILSILGPLGEGSLVSLELFCITLLLSIPLGVALALMRLSRHRWLGVTVSGYLWLMRGTPLMLQLLFIYYALPLLPGGGIQLPDYSDRKSVV